MIRQRIELDQLEAAVGVAREKQVNNFWPGRESWARRAADLEATIADLRARTTPATTVSRGEEP